MIEEFASRDWADNHQRFSDDVVKALKTLWRGFERLNAAQFDAPWLPKQSVQSSAVMPILTLIRSSRAQSKE